jgi:hypothetical protein
MQDVTAILEEILGEADGPVLAYWTLRSLVRDSDPYIQCK